MTNRLLLLIVTLSISATAFARTNYAVIIGVTEYLPEMGYNNLVGPRNDALLLYEFLKQRDFDEKNIKLLIEDIPEAKRPTYNHIIGALNEVVDEVGDGDFVYFHFSGHGSQQPTQDPEETDGLDEIILPADTGKWSSQNRTVENVITDDVIATYVDKIRSKKAFVWMVFDSCHSGTMTRGNVVSRKISRKSLGIPELGRQRGGPVADTSAPIEMPTEDKDKGGYIGFFAAQTNQETPEMALAADLDNDEPYGLFTFNLVKVLATYPNISYKQAAEQILKNYASHPWYGTTPHFAGTHMDAQIFGARSRGSIKQWKLDEIDGELYVNAGSLHQIGDGAIFAVINDPAAVTSDYQGYVEATDVGDLRSKVKPTFLEGDRFAVETRVLSEIIKPNDIAASAYARLIATNYAIGLKVGIIEKRVPKENKRKISKGDEIITLLRDEGVYPISLAWVDSGQPSDVKLLNTGEDIYILADYEELPCPYGSCGESPAYIKVPLTLSSNDALKDLRVKLRAIAKTLNLMRLSNTMETSDLFISLDVTTPSGESRSIDASERPVLREGDELSLVVTNETEEPQDLTILFVDSSYGINAIYPAENQFNRFMPYDEKVIPIGSINVETVGAESLIIIANSVFRTSPASDFRFLAQDKIRRTRGLNDSSSQISTLLTHFQTASEDQPGSKKKSNKTWIDAETSKQGSIQVFQWITGPRL